MQSDEEMHKMKQQDRKKRLIVIGCAVVVVLAVVVCILLAVALRLRAQLTVDKPILLDIPHIAKEEAQALGKKYVALKKGMMQRKPCEITLEGEEVDKLVLLAEEFKSIRGKASFSPEGDRVRVRTCLPLPPLPLLGGRYLCGTFVFEAAIEGGRLSAKLLNGVTESGRPFPQWIVDKVNDELSAPDLQERLGIPNSRKIDSMVIKDGMVVLRTK